METKIDPDGNTPGSLLNLTDIVIFTRSNIAWGISDKAFVLGGTVTSAVISNWQWMPGVIMMSQMCPKGMEATLYALLAGCHNMGGAISDYLGAFVLEYLECNPSGTSLETHKFDNLWKASFVATMLPAITVVLRCCIEYLFGIPLFSLELGNWR